jgi:hypothetical protein
MDSRPFGPRGAGTFAEVEGVDAPRDFARAEGWQLENVDIDALVMPAGLDVLGDKRDSQRALPSFGALADRQVVYLRQEWDGDDPATYLTDRAWRPPASRRWT